MTVLWICALFEILYYSTTLVPSTSLSPTVSTIICPRTSDPHIRVTPMFTIGIVAVVLGSYIRLDCFRTLGQLFTFDLTIHPLLNLSLWRSPMPRMCVRNSRLRIPRRGPLCSQPPCKLVACALLGQYHPNPAPSQTQSYRRQFSGGVPAGVPWPSTPYTT